jgi:hypothetical protein
LGYSVNSIYKDGGISANDDLIYIAKNPNPSRLLLKGMRCNEEGVWEPSPNGPHDIRSASVIGCYEDDEIGVLCDASNKYYYKSQGTRTKQILPF